MGHYYLNLETSLLDSERAAEGGLANEAPVDQYFRHFGRVLTVGNGWIKLVDVF